MNEVPALLDVATINQFLWRHDLMGTGCNLNDEMEYEYWAIADGIHQRLNLSEQLRGAVIAEFDEAFWPGCLADDPKKECLNGLLVDLQTHLSQLQGK